MGSLRPFSLFEPDVHGVLKGAFPPMWMTSEAMPPTIKVDVAETPERYSVKADMPGVAKEDIRVDVDGNVVSIAAEVRREKVDEKDGKVLRSERYVGTMSRAFTLPVDVDVGRAEATYADGVLTLQLPKTTGQPAHRVPIG